MEGGRIGREGRKGRKGEGGRRGREGGRDGRGREVVRHLKVHQLTMFAYQLEKSHRS